MKLQKALEKARQEHSDNLTDIPVSEGQTGTPAADDRLQENRPYFKQAPGTGKSKIVALDSRKAERNRCVCLRSEGEAVEKYKFLRTQVLQRTKKNNWNTVMLTSALPGEGKTLTAINLALSFAREFDRSVLLVDCDLRQQMVCQYMGLPGENGLIDYLNDRKEISDLIVSPGIDKFTVISGGETVQDSTELLNSPKMRSLVSEMKDRYPDRYIFLDPPPLLSSADALAFAPLVDCVIVVVEAGKTQKEDLEKATAMIPEGKMLGMVLNEKGAG